MACRRNIPTQAMCCRLRLLILAACALVLSQHFEFAYAKRSSTQKSSWLTLTGSEPLVIARGGFPGLLPDSSMAGYQVANMTSLVDLVFWCDVQLTKDGVGICFPSLKLDNASSIEVSSHAKKNTYNVSGVPMTGYFSIDHTSMQLQNVNLIQGIYSRSPNFDASGFMIVTPQTLFDRLHPRGFWLNVQHDAFYSQHNLSMRNFILGASKNLTINYLSSPELNFLKGIAPRFASAKTNLIFRFMDWDETEPTTKKTYGTLLKNLTFIRSFASGILVPKAYIWPVDKSLYLLPATKLVRDAHEAGLLVFAADFANDYVFSYNYSYNPVAEYLQFIDNGDFSADGVLTDFPTTPSKAIGCFAHLGKNVRGQAKPLVISQCGASGDYPSCTDLAYSKAILDGADVIDCSVQMSKDGVPFCLRTINLMDSTNVVQTAYYDRTATIPELNSNPGIFTFNLTWKEIQGLKPAIWNPFFKTFTLFRNPKFKDAGKLVSLDDFLAMTKNATSLAGVLVKIEHAAYLAEKQGLSMTDAVLSALNKSGYGNQTSQKLMIQSTDSSVLEAFNGKSYELVYEVNKIIRDVLNSTVKDIKSLVSTVVIDKESIYPTANYFLARKTNVLEKLHAFNLSVFVQTFTNEYVSQVYDFFSDPITEINTYVQAGVDGIVTEFPQTAASYKKNRCLPLVENTPGYMLPVEAGGLLELMAPTYLPPPQAPSPVLSDVSEPPLPPAEKPLTPLPAPAPGSSPASTPGGSSKGSNGHREINVCASFSVLALAASTLLLF